MINMVALILLLTSLFAAQVWSLNPPPSNREEDVTVKEGHRAVIVEYCDDQDSHHNTKVSISQLQDPISDGGLLDNPTEKIKQAANVIPTKCFGQGHSPSKLICDPLGKCTRKIARAISKAKAQVSDVAEELAHGAIEKVEDAYKKAKEKLENAYEKAKDSGSHKADDVKERSKDTMKSAKDIGKTIGVDTATNVSKHMENLRESTQQARSKIRRIWKSVYSKEMVNFYDC